MLGDGQGEDGAGAGGEFVEDEAVGVAEVGLPLGGAEDDPALGGDPVGTGQVGRGNEAFLFEQIVVDLGAGDEGDEGTVVAVEIDEHEHLSADGFITDPEDEIVAPLPGLDGVGEGEEEGADAFDVHAGSILAGYGLDQARTSGSPHPPRGWVRNPFIFSDLRD